MGAAQGKNLLREPQMMQVLGYQGLENAKKSLENLNGD